jgi:hypothetical protein
MRRVHLQKDVDLLRALIVLQEDATSERLRQEKMSRRIRRRAMNEKDEEEDKGEEDKDADAGEKKPAEDEKKPAKKDDGDDKLPGADRLENSTLPQGKSPTSKDIAQRVNFIRAGASLKDPEIQRAIAVWISQLREPERLAAYTTLDALAQIVLGGKSPAEAPTFTDPAGLTIKGGNVSSPPPEVKKSAPAAPAKKSSGPVPITVGEGVVKRLKEVDVPVRSGRVVPFGSKSHISDLEERINDLRRIRSYQEKGSDTHHALGAAIAALKKQLHAANRSGSAGNPRTQPVPALVEKEK